MNKDIECALINKSLSFLSEALSQSQRAGGFAIDINGLIKQNLDEILTLKLENSQLQ